MTLTLQNINEAIDMAYASDVKRVSRVANRPGSLLMKNDPDIVFLTQEKEVSALRAIQVGETMWRMFEGKFFINDETLEHAALTAFWGAYDYGLHEKDEKRDIDASWILAPDAVPPDLDGLPGEVAVAGVKHLLSVLQRTVGHMFHSSQFAEGLPVACWRIGRGVQQYEADGRVLESLASTMEGEGESHDH